MKKFDVKRVAAVGAFAAAAITLLAASAASTAAPARIARTHASHGSNLTIGLPGIPPVFLAVRPYVAQDDGFYAKYHANVTLKGFVTGTDALRAVSDAPGTTHDGRIQRSAAVGAEENQHAAAETPHVVDLLDERIDGDLVLVMALVGCTVRRECRLRRRSLVTHHGGREAEQI